MSAGDVPFQDLKEIDGQITKLLEIAEACWALATVLKKYDSRETASLLPEVELGMAWKQTFGTPFLDVEETQ
jgi:hypothetical protein